jgi:prephenate dehydratase
MEFEDLDLFNRGLKHITPLTEHLAVLGVYKKGTTH